ncbi:MAG TPA: hypothetical protein VHX60_13220 [Acidobacteriaceae bacterium]|jgi:hypothetical protein|nr:hypothetical protein [Acidobacteriaceae bacterium]
MGLALCALALPRAGWAQAPGTADTVGRGYKLFGGYSFLSNSFHHTSGTSYQPLNGWDASITGPLTSRVGLKLEASGYYGTNSGSPQHPLFFLGGGEYSRRVGRETVFAEGLAGLGHLNANWWGGEFPGKTISFAADAGGGLDTPLGPRLALRIQGDFQYSNFTVPDNQIHGLPNYFARLITGFVWRF